MFWKIKEELSHSVEEVAKRLKMEKESILGGFRFHTTVEGGWRADSVKDGGSTYIEEKTLHVYESDYASEKTADDGRFQLLEGKARDRWEDLCAKIF